MKGKGGDTKERNINIKMRELAKVMHYFPLILRLTRMYTSPKIAEQMR